MPAGSRTRGRAALAMALATLDSVLVVVLPAVLVFIAWTTLSWQRSRKA